MLYEVTVTACLTASVKVKLAVEADTQEQAHAAALEVAEGLDLRDFAIEDYELDHYEVNMEQA